MLLILQLSILLSVMRNLEQVPSCTGNKGDDTCRQSVTVTCWQPLFRGGSWACSTTASQPAEYHARKKQQHGKKIIGLTMMLLYFFDPRKVTRCYRWEHDLLRFPSNLFITWKSRSQTDEMSHALDFSRSDMEIQNKVKTSFLGI